jgi:hypothetical protein
MGLATQVAIQAPAGHQGPGQVQVPGVVRAWTHQPGAESRRARIVAATSVTGRPARGHRLVFALGEIVHGVGVEVGDDGLDLTARRHPVAPRRGGDR